MVCRSACGSAGGVRSPESLPLRCSYLDFQTDDRHGCSCFANRNRNELRGGLGQNTSCVAEGDAVLQPQRDGPPPQTCGGVVVPGPKHKLNERSYGDGQETALACRVPTE